MASQRTCVRSLHPGLGRTHSGCARWARCACMVVPRLWCVWRRDASSTAHDPAGRLPRSICRAGSSLAARRPHCAPAVPGSSCVRCPCVVVEPPTSCRGTRRSRCARRINARLGARPAFTGGGGEQQLLGTCPKTRRRTCVCGWRRPVGGVVCRSRCPRLLIVAMLVVAHVTTGPWGQQWSRLRAGAASGAHDSDRGWAHERPEAATERLRVLHSSAGHPVVRT